MQSLVNIVLFILAIISVPVIIFLLSRKLTEWIIGLLLLFALLFYYSATIVQFLPIHQISVTWLAHLLYSYRDFVLLHWPQLNGLMKVDHAFAATFIPIIILWLGGVVRFIVVRFVPKNGVREITHDYWLYITSFLILLLIVSSVFDWNFLTTTLVFVVIVFIVAAGLYRLFPDSLALIFVFIRLVSMEIWIDLRYIALLAATIAKHLYRFLRDIYELYDKYVREPIKRLINRLFDLQRRRLKKVIVELEEISIEDQDTVTISEKALRKIPKRMKRQEREILTNTLAACDALIHSRPPYPNSLLGAAQAALAQFQNLEVAASDPSFQRATQEFTSALQRGDQAAQIQWLTKGSRIAARIARKEML